VRFCNQYVLYIFINSYVRLDPNKIVIVNHEKDANNEVDPSDISDEVYANDNRRYKRDTNPETSLPLPNIEHYASNVKYEAPEYNVP